MNTRIGVALLAASCASYSVRFDQQSTTPVPVILGSTVEIPAGIVATARARPFRNDAEMSSDTDVQLVVDHPEILLLSPVVIEEFGEGVWALIGVSPGHTSISTTVAGDPAEPIEVEVTAQD